MQQPRFHTGDRVVAKNPLVGVPAGTVGMVMMVGSGNYYNVYFAAVTALCFLAGADLMFAPGTATDEPVEEHSA